MLKDHKLIQDGKIPSSFELGGNTIDVRFDNVFNEVLDSIGYSRSWMNMITLSDEHELQPVPESRIVQTFFHEMVHMVLFAMGKEELSKDESFVSTFSEFLYQGLRTMKFK